MALNIYLIRHGKTVWNIEGRLQGSGDSPLVEEGILGAKKTGQALKDVKFSAAYSSMQKRAQDTANYILAENNLANIPQILSTHIRFEYVKSTLSSASRQIPLPVQFWQTQYMRQPTPTSIHFLHEIGTHFRLISQARSLKLVIFMARKACPRSQMIRYQKLVKCAPPWQNQSKSRRLQMCRRQDLIFKARRRRRRRRNPDSHNKDR